MNNHGFVFRDSSKKGYGRISIKKFVEEYLYRVDLDADYQRGTVWDRSDQELLLDSIANDIDIPKLYLAIVADNEQFDFECIDGKQRIMSLLSFYKPEKDSDESKKPLTLRLFDHRYTYEELSDKHPSIAKKLDEYELDFTVYRKEDLDIDDDYIRKIFKRLNLGVELNSGEKLHAQIGTVRDFVFEKIGKHGPFFRNTSLSEKRFSREFTLAQILLNSKYYSENSTYTRARLTDLEKFFEDNYKLPIDDPAFIRIETVLKIMDKAFGERAALISSRAVAGSAYLFFERLYTAGRTDDYAKFVDFYLALLSAVKDNLSLLRDFSTPQNKMVLEEFQKHVSQASAEGPSFDRREKFLHKAFTHYLKTGEVIGDSE